MATDLDIVNQALVRIGAEPVASLNVSTAQALAASTLYDTVVKRMLAETPWTFALKGALLPEIVPPTNSYQPFNRYEYVFQLPSDTIRVLGLESLCRFQMAQDRLYTNDKHPRLVYVADVASSYFPAYFEDLVVHELAASFAISVTDTTSRADLYQSYVRRMKPRAMSIDAQQTPPEVFDLMRVYARISYNPISS